MKWANFSKIDNSYNSPNMKKDSLKSPITIKEIEIVLKL
jgi:hypothetical protein